MAESKYLKKTQGNGASTTLSASITNTDTSAPLTSDTAFDGEGMLLIDEGQATEEFAYGTGKTGSSITILADDRGLEGGSAQAHSDSATVKGVITSGMWNNMVEAVSKTVNATDGTLDTTKVVGITSGNINSALTGWIASSDTWTYASATTFTIAGVDRTAMFPKGTKIKLTQTTAKYFYVVDSAFSTNTTVTVTGGITYTLANAAITSPYYSYASTPQGFPAYFNFTFGTTSASGSMTIATEEYTFCNFKIMENEITIRTRLSFTTGGTASNIIYLNTLPVAPIDPSNNINVGDVFMLGDGFTLGSYLDSASNRIRIYKVDAGNFSLGASKGVAGTFKYLF